MSKIVRIKRHDMMGRASHVRVWITAVLCGDLCYLNRNGGRFVNRPYGFEQILSIVRWSRQSIIF